MNQAEPHRGRRRILVIDDEDDLRLIAELSLAQIGSFEVELAASGEEGVVLALAHPPDAILLDASMPQMDGIETLARLCQQPSLRQVPVVFLTARVLPDERAEYLALGAAGVIAKPFDPMALPAQLATLLRWS